jgi:hypothetical protein
MNTQSTTETVEAQRRIQAMEEATRTIEERILEKVLDGEEITQSELAEVTSEITPEEFFALLEDQYRPEIELHEETIFQLIKLDPLFLTSTFVQHQLVVWRAACYSDGNAEKKLKRIGSALIPSQSDRRGILRALGPVAYDALVRDLKAFRETAEHMSIAPVAEAALILIEKSIEYRKCFFPPDKRNEEDWKKFTDSLGALNLKPTDLRSSFREFKSEWIQLNPGAIARDILASVAEGITGHPIDSESVRKDIQRGRDDQGLSNKRPKQRKRNKG